MVKVLAWGYAPPRRPTRFRLTYACPRTTPKAQPACTVPSIVAWTGDAWPHRARLR